MEAASQIESVVVFARDARVRRIASVIEDTMRSEVAGPAVVNAQHVADEIVTEAGEHAARLVIDEIDDQPGEAMITERIPISEVEQVEVHASAPDAFLLEDHPGGEEVTQVTARALDERGLVSWSVELPPLGRRAVTLEYKVKSQRGVAGV